MGRSYSKNQVLYSKRLRAGLSQAELAAAVHASRQTINAIENSRVLPNVSLALAIASAVDTSVELLFGREPAGG